MSRFDDDMVDAVAFVIYQAMKEGQRNAGHGYVSPVTLAKLALKAAGVNVPAKGEAFCIGGQAHGTVYDCEHRDIMISPRYRPITISNKPGVDFAETAVHVDRYNLRRLGPYPCWFWVLTSLSDEDAACLIPKWLKA